MTMIVTVDKEELLEKLKSNRERHIATTLEATHRYAEQVRRNLVELMDKLDKDMSSDININATAPVSHAGDYDRAMAMLEMHSGEEIELTEELFANYVMDDWAWGRKWRSTIASFGLGQFRAPDSTPSLYTSYYDR